MPRLIRLWPLLALAACAAPVPPAPFRDPGGPIYSNAVLDPAALAGDWVQVAGFGPLPGGCAGGTARLGRAAGGTIAVASDLCLGGERVRFDGAARVLAAGRFAPVGAPPPLDRPWWVIWADADARTLVVGTPSGEFGFILDRGGALPPDRLAAAREVLAFNGYDLARLRVY